MLFWWRAGETPARPRSAELEDDAGEDRERGGLGPEDAPPEDDGHEARASQERTLVVLEAALGAYGEAGHFAPDGAPP